MQLWPPAPLTRSKPDAEARFSPFSGVRWLKEHGDKCRQWFRASIPTPYSRTVKNRRVASRRQAQQYSSNWEGLNFIALLRDGS